MVNKSKVVHDSGFGTLCNVEILISHASPVGEKTIRDFSPSTCMSATKPQNISTQSHTSRGREAVPREKWGPSNAGV